jgi:HK97 family phage prohead protease
MKSVRLVCEAKLTTPADSASKGAIEARVTTWGAREGADGRRFFYQPEGFADWAAEFESTGRPLPMHVNHASDAIPVGEWTGFSFDGEGMLAEGRIFMNTSAGQDLYTVMTESPAMFGGVSVGAFAETCEWVDEQGEPTDSPDGYFQITKGGLREVSVVMYPNNPMAEISRLEYYRPDGSPDLKVFEKTLRDAGFGKQDAAAAVSALRVGLTQRDAARVTQNAPPMSESEADAAIVSALVERELIQNLNRRLESRNVASHP